MPFSVAPLVLHPSFARDARRAKDLVDAADLDNVLGAIEGKINEIIAALDVTMRDDDTLADGVVDAATLSDDARAELVSMVNDTVRA